jgi:hypothetical protein
VVGDNILLIPRLNKEVAAGMHLVLLVALVVLSIMDQKVGMEVVGEGIRLEYEVEAMYAQVKDFCVIKKVLDM